MFEHITLSDLSAPDGSLIDIGNLAQCLIFYRKTRVIVGQVTFGLLVRTCGVEELLHLCAMGALEIEFFESLTGVISKDVGSSTFFDSGTVSSQTLKYQQVARKLFDQIAKPSGKGANRNFAKFDRVVIRSDYSSEMLKQGRQDWLDTVYLREAIGTIIKNYVPDYDLPKDYRVEVMHTHQGFQFSSSLDFPSIDALYRKRNPGTGPKITPAALLIKIADARRDLMVASRFGSEFAVSANNGRILENKFRAVLAKASKGRESGDSFQETIVKDLPSIRDVVISRQRNFSDVIKLVEKAEPFKAWLSKQSDAEDLREAYLRDVTHLDWADKLPPKSMRWLLITGAGLALGATTHPVLGALAGTVLSGADTFLLDRLLKGWKPNQFIEGSMKPFVRAGA